MKIILSRKGFDGSKNKGRLTAGGYASPILPDGKMLSLPIPRCEDKLEYSKIRAPGGKTYIRIIEELCPRANIVEKGAHLDPDLVVSTRDRRQGWYPAFGTSSRSASHLDNHCVSEGDLFLFFGWFRHTEEVNGQLCYSGGRKGFHAIFGYLEIGEIVRVHEETQLPSWLQDHPNAMPYRRQTKKNRIYIAKPKLSILPNSPGGGAFQFDERKMLTKKGESNRSHWNLDPKIFRHVKISYHPENSWKEGYFQSAGRGQEFVIHADEGVIKWASNLIKNSRLW